MTPQHKQLFYELRKRPTIPDTDVELTARLSDWAILNNIPRACVDAALDYRREQVPSLMFPSMVKLAKSFYREFEAGYVIGLAEAGKERGE